MTKSPAAAIRISGYDLARAVAVIGMVLVNYKVVMATSRRNRYAAG